MSAASPDMSLTGSADALAWLERHKNQDAEELTAQALPLLRDLAGAPRAVYAHLGALETWRVPLLSAVRTLIQECAFRAVPMSEREHARVTQALQVLRALRDAYTSAYSSAPLEPVEPPNAQSFDDFRRDPTLRDRMAAFGAQSKAIAPKLLISQRLISAQAALLEASYRMRMSVPQTEWDMLMRYAKQAKQADFIDHGVVDPLYPEFRVTGRWAFVGMVLLRLARPETLGPLEFELAHGLCKRFGSTVKFRLDEGDAALKPSPWPSFAVTAFATVRLDTRTLTAELKRLESELLAGASTESLGIEARISPPSACRTVQELLSVWRTPAQAGPSWRRPLGESARIVPGFHAIAGGLNKPNAPFDPTATLGRSIYEYRRFDNDHVPARPSEDPVIQRLKQLVESGETWQLQGENAIGFLFIRRARTPRLQLDQLSLISTGNGFQRAALFLGRIDSLRQNLPADAHEAPLQEVGIRLLLGSPVLISIKLESGTFEDSFMLRTAPPGGTLTALEMRELDFDQSSLILPLARHKENTITDIVLDGALHRIQIGRLLFRGQDFDQVAFRLL